MTDMSQGEYEPHSAAYDNPNIDLSRKMPLTFTKSGFRYRFKIEKATYFQQYLIYEDLPSNGLHYGVYRDKELTDATAEVDLQEIMPLELWENTTEENGHVEETLEPGTYYIAAYTTDYWDSFRIAFERGHTVM